VLTGDGYKRELLIRRVIILLCALLLGAALTGVSLYKMTGSEITDWPVRYLILFVLGLTIFSLAFLSLIFFWVRLNRADSRVFRLAVVAGAGSFLVSIVLVEVVLQIVVISDQNGSKVGGFRFAPNWSDITRKNLFLLDAATPSGNWSESYLVFDPELGWVVGRSRESDDGLYFSSEEGIRSAKPGVRLADRKAPFRIAIIGDSNAFSLEVPFEHSWGAYLEAMLGADVQILNFGVNGYGVDQAVLRLERDVHQWSPDIVILAMIQHDLIRSMSVYPFVTFPAWKMPFAKPRMIQEAGRLVSLNTPLPDPHGWFRDYDLSALPNIEHDYGFRSASLNMSAGDFPLLIRLVTTFLPRYSSAGNAISDEEIIRLNAALLRRFDRLASESGRSLTVYLPTTGAHDYDPVRPDNLARRAMAEAGLASLDLTECLKSVPAGERNVPSGNHFSAMANRAIATCVAPAVTGMLAAR
jgi:hypothetical protein